MRYTALLVKPPATIYYSRLIIVLIGAAILLASAAWLARERPPVLVMADAMVGESWYGIKLGAAHVGFMYTYNHIDLAGRRHFRTVTHFRLEEGAPQTVDKHLIFAATPPFALHDARYRNHYGVDASGGDFSVRVVPTAADDPGQQQAVINRNGRPSSATVNWDFTLEHFLDFELWLEREQPDPGATHIAQNPDFEQLRIDKRSYKVLARNEQGYLISANALLAATTSQLDQHYRPLKLTMAGVFNVERMPKAAAIALRDLPHKTSYLFPLDQPITDHLRTSRLKLRVHNPPPGFASEMTLNARVRGGVREPERYQGEELRYPITHPEVQGLAQRALADAGDDVIAQLVEVTHRRLNYQENQPAGAVTRALQQGHGECTDFADLFTTIARAAGFTARTVYGLAYRDGTRPSFMFHAWNEIAQDGRWRAVDATWGQAYADATHIKLDPEVAAVLMLAANTGEVSFSVLDVAYEDS
ncbi:MAG: transglutaminase domain-containing protein [Pseudomonadota bacterium]